MKYNYFQDEKLEYEDIEIPDELLFMVRRTVAADRRKKAAANRRRILKTAGSIAAVLFLCLTIGVNSSYAFAETAVKIPIVKNVAKAVVVRSYREEIIAVYEENKISNQSKKGEEEAPEPSQEETLPTESGNDVPGQTETPEKQLQSTEQEPEEVLEGIDAWKAEMTPEKLKEVTEVYTSDMEKKYADTPEKLRTILLADLPGKDISLYGYHENGITTGVALRIGNAHRYFDWKYMNGSLKLPELVCEDIDGDGNEEIVVSLYNGTVQKKAVSEETAKEVSKEISKENIAAPGEESGEKTGVTEKAGAAEKAGTTEKTAGEKDTKAADTSETVKSGTDGDSGNNTSKESVGGEISAENTEDTQETDSERPAEEKTETELPTVSENDVKVPAENKKEEPEPPAGELWVVSPRGENWSTAVLSLDDYESQILHQLKATYDTQTGKIQLYLAEEPFGSPVEGPAKLTYEAINLSSERTFTVKKGISLQFQMEVTLSKENGEKVYVLLEPKLGAEIRPDNDSFTVENIKKL